MMSLTCLEFVVCAHCAQASDVFECLVYGKFVNRLFAGVEELVSKGESWCTVK